MNAKAEERPFSLDELAKQSALPRRTVRYYIQIGLLDRPEGAGRGAHYTRRHLEQLMKIREWRRQGLSLERIRELLEAKAAPGQEPPPRARTQGRIELRSNVLVDEGVEIVIDPKRCGMTAKEVGRLIAGVMDLCREIQNGK